MAQKVEINPATGFKHVYNVPDSGIIKPSQPSNRPKTDAGGRPYIPGFHFDEKLGSYQKDVPEAPKQAPTKIILDPRLGFSPEKELSVVKQALDQVPRGTTIGIKKYTETITDTKSPDYGKTALVYQPYIVNLPNQDRRTIPLPLERSQNIDLSRYGNLKPSPTGTRMDLTPGIPERAFYEVPKMAADNKPFTGAMLSPVEEAPRRRLYQNYEEFSIATNPVETEFLKPILKPVEKPIQRLKEFRYESFDWVQKEIQNIRKFAWEKTGPVGAYLDVPIGAIAGGVGAIKSFAYPIKTIESAGYAITHPREAGAAFGQHLEKEGLPYVGGELVGSYYTTKAIVSGIEKGVRLAQYPFYKKPELSQLTQEEIKAIEPYTRQRATLMLKTSDGKYLLGRTPDGNLISIGGGIEAGQTARSAALAELSQETGLSLKDIANFKYAGKVVTPEETFHLFTGVVKDISKIQPSSDISGGIVTISPSNLLIKGSTGSTAFQPVTRFSLFPYGQVRSYEAGIINYLETGEPLKFLSVSTEQGRYFLGTQSRYNVPADVQKNYLNQENQILAHGTQSTDLVKRFFNDQKKLIIEEAQRGGEGVGLYLQPPSSAQKILARVIKLEDYSGKGSVLSSAEIKALQKSFEISIPKEQAPGYIGLSYMGYKVPSAEYGGVRVGSPAAYLFKEATKPPIAPTLKSLRGVESELQIVPGTEIESIGNAGRIWLGWKLPFLQPAKIVTPAEQITLGERAITNSVSEYYDYVTRTEVASRTIITSASLLPKVSKQSSVARSIQLDISRVQESIAKEFNLSKSTIILQPSRPSPGRPSRSVTSPDVNILPPSLPSISAPSSQIIPPSRPSISPSPQLLLPPPIPKLGIYERPSELKKRTKQYGPGYNVLVKVIKTDKFRRINHYPLSKSRAKDIGTFYIAQSLARTFRITKNTLDAQADYEFGYIPEGYFQSKRATLREYRIKKGRPLETPEQFIQKAKFALGTPEEKRQIQAFRKMAKRILK